MFSSFRVRFRTTLVLLYLSLCFGSNGLAQGRPTLPTPKVKVRAITAFINLDRGQYQQQIAETLKMLKYARTVYESRGFEVQTIRISTQPFPEYTAGLSTEQAVAFFKSYEALATKEKFDAAIGPAMLHANDSEIQADVLVEILRNTTVLNGSLVVADSDGVHWGAVKAAARVIGKLSQTTEHGQGSFRFAALALVPPLTPFYPGSYHTGFGHQFAIALQSANVVAAAFQGAADVDTAGKRLVAMLRSEALEVERHAERIDRDLGWSYVGIDLSPAPLKEVSIGEGLENLTGHPLGSSGTLTAAATVTAALQDIGVKQTGYSGLMLPVMEDSRLAQRWSEGRLTLDALLSYSAVCGTGLDTVPLPGDVSEQQLARIIGDVASLAVKWHKPLSARLMPAPGKNAGDATDFANPYVVNVTLQRLEPK